MHSLLLISILFIYTISTLASPALLKRVDLDHDGVPDWCAFNADGSANCLENGQWTLVPSSIASPPTSAAALASITSRKTSTPKTTTVKKIPIFSTFLSATTAAATFKQIPASSATTSPPTSTTVIPYHVAGTLPSPSQFKADNGTKWTIEYVGDIKYTGAATQALAGDKCRTSQIGSQVIWNCGDMMCPPDYTICGFAMGPAFYGTSDVMTINTGDVAGVQNNNFVNAWSGDALPVAPQSAWGMDTSNIAPINNSHGVVYATEAWRGAPDGTVVQRGNVVATVTLGQTMPIATRMGPLLTDASYVQLGLLAILRDGNYIYIYSAGGPSSLTVTRVPADDSVFDATKYESLLFGTNNTWVSGIPLQTDAKFGMMSADDQFGCSVYGSVYYSSYLNQYVIICNVFMSFTNMYTSDTPYGPWSGQYSLLSGWHGYGSMAHPEYSTDGGKTIYFSQGPNDKFNMFKVTFGY